MPTIKDITFDRVYLPSLDAEDLVGDIVGELNTLYTSNGEFTLTLPPISTTPIGSVIGLKQDTDNGLVVDNSSLYPGEKDPKVRTYVAHTGYTFYFIYSKFFGNPMWVHIANAVPVGSGADVVYTNPLPTPIAVGGIDIGSSFSNVPVPDMFDRLLYPELFPNLVNPSLTAFTANISELREIGALYGINFNATFNRGSISPAYGTSGFRSGLPNAYIYTGPGGGATYEVDSLSHSISLSDYLVVSGVQSWTCKVAYDAGEQPKSSFNNDYNSPLPAGESNTRTVIITGVYPWFATTVNISTLTKQALVAPNVTYVQCSMIAESDGIKQKVELPAAWAAVTGIQFYNTVTSSWEWLGGSAVNSLTTFSVTDTVKSINGTDVDYKLYTHNGSAIGARQLRFYL